MVGDGTLRNNNINGLELLKDAFDLFSQFTLSGCFQINHDTNISFRALSNELRKIRNWQLHSTVLNIKLEENQNQLQYYSTLLAVDTDALTLGPVSSTCIYLHR